MPPAHDKFQSQQRGRQNLPTVGSPDHLAAAATIAYGTPFFVPSGPLDSRQAARLSLIVGMTTLIIGVVVLLVGAMLSDSGAFTSTTSTSVVMQAAEPFSASHPDLASMAAPVQVAHWDALDTVLIVGPTAPISARPDSGEPLASAPARREIQGALPDRDRGPLPVSTRHDLRLDLMAMTTWRHPSSQVFLDSCPCPTDGSAAIGDARFLDRFTQNHE